MTTDPESSKAAFAIYRDWSEWATIAVFVGLLGDILVIFLFSKDKPKAETWLAFACTLLIAVGVFGEYRFGGKASEASDQLQRISEGKVADSNRKAEEARKEAARLSKVAEDEKTARVKLEKQLAPRAISESDRKTLGEQLHQFATGFSGRKVSILSYSADVEGAVFSIQIMDILTRAGIAVDPAIGRGMPMGLAEMGVKVTGPLSDAAFIKELVLKLHTRSDTAFLGIWDSKYNGVQVIVGVKPVSGLPTIKPFAPLPK